MTTESIESARESAYRCFAAGDLEQALALLQGIRRDFGADAQGANDLAVVLFRLGRRREALERFREAQALAGEGGNLLVDNLIDALSSLVNDLQPRLPPRASPAPASFCPVCGTEGAGYRPLPPTYRQQAERYGYAHFGQGEMTALDTYSCRHCGASDRERLYAYWISEELAAGRIRAGMRLLHFAPEAALGRFLTSLPGLHYETADLMMKGVDHQVDITNLPFDDATYDVFICSHVLEHVGDDRKAIAELARITRPGGFGILMAPVIVGFEQTIEDPTLTDPAERWRRFGQDDHVRLYASQDFAERIEAADFQVDRFDAAHFGDPVFALLGLKPSSVLYVARR